MSASLSTSWHVWQQLIASAEKLEPTSPGYVRSHLWWKKGADNQWRTLEKVQAVVDDTRRQTSPEPDDMYYLDLAQLTLRSVSAGKAGGGVLQLKQGLQSFLEIYANRLSCFDHVKDIAEKLEPSDLISIAFDFMPQIPALKNKVDGSNTAELTLLKLQYFAASSGRLYAPSASEKGKFDCMACGCRLTTRKCTSCFKTIFKHAHNLHSKLRQSSSHHEDILPETGILMANCKMQEVFVGRRTFYASRSEPIYRNLIQCILILEEQLSQSPRHTQLSLLLVQLHTVLGSAHRAREIWANLGANSEAAQALAPLFFDRFSTVAPACLVDCEETSAASVEYLASSAPTRLDVRQAGLLSESFQAGEYRRLLDMPKQIDMARASGRRALSLNENARAMRMRGHPLKEMIQDSRYGKLQPLCLI
jgi:hypothetical protein